MKKNTSAVSDYINKQRKLCLSCFEMAHLMLFSLINSLLLYPIFMAESEPFKGKKAAYCTLGCKLNFSETATIAGMLHSLGVSDCGDGEVADICIINTCTVTDVADHKCRQAIRRMARLNPGALVVVTGCMAQLDARRTAAIDGVDLVLGAHEKASLIDYLRQTWALREAQRHSLHISHTTNASRIKAFAPSCSRGNRTRYYLKVQDGCSYYCTYCAIPFARGRSRSPEISLLVEQAKAAADAGAKEIVLTGVNIGDFGRQTGQTFLQLVKALDTVDGIERYRISSLEPDLIDDNLIEWCAQSRRFMPHFHIPLQSGSDTVLRLMHRRYDTALFAHKIELIRKLLPTAFIGVDVMAGMRGERPELFEEAFTFIQSLDIAQLHVFPYSERPGTAALKIPFTVSESDKKERCNRLLQLSKQKRDAFYARFIGTEADVLFEKSTRGKPMHGFTANYIRAELPPTTASASLDNTIVRVRLGSFTDKGDALTAYIIQ